jgi:hypothetical protein
MAKKPEDKKQEAKPKQAAAPRKENAAQPKKQAAPKAEAPAKPAGPQLPVPPARLAQQYREKIVPDLMKKFGYKTVMQVPRIRKITLNMGVGETTSDKKMLDNALADMVKIAGQKPVVTKARRSIANFKLRAGFPIGCMVTLRGARMYEFLDRLPRDRLRQGRYPARHEHRHYHHRQERRRGARAARCVPLPVQAGRREAARRRQAKH